jgi:hypothetical protein
MMPLMYQKLSTFFLSRCYPVLFTNRWYLFPRISARLQHVYLKPRFFEHRAGSGNLVSSLTKPLMRTLTQSENERIQPCWTTVCP